jgi:NAD(P)-dependent dehydrogenase (short-subunit alcohol dehydrogenase family)
MQRTTTRTVLITGTSSGIGRAAVDAFLAAGWNVVATMRTPSLESLGPGARSAVGEQLLVAGLDVTDQTTIESTVAAAVERFGAIDVLVNNAGYALVGPFESFTPDQLARQLDTNVLGLMAVTRAVLPHMRARRAGALVNVSSVGGRITFPLYAPYHATKWAVEGFSESLQHEVRRFGIRVRIVEPGPISTSFYGGSMDDSVADAPADYLPWADEALERMRASGANGASPERVARVIVRAAGSRGGRLRWPTDPTAHLLLGMRRLLPERLAIAIIRRATGV